jgi:plasmid maintenance system antidote protein VapI
MINRRALQHIDFSDVTVPGERAVSAETAILLSSRFETSADFWMGLQTAHDLEIARGWMQRVA